MKKWLQLIFPFSFGYVVLGGLLASRSISDILHEFFIILISMAWAGFYYQVLHKDD